MATTFSRWRPHPWHGLTPGPDAPRVVLAYKLDPEGDQAITVDGLYGAKAAQEVIVAAMEDYAEHFANYST
ncbi:MAG: hypothetical protein JKY65_08810 [Planctomycetes bacterium]|nr:hypothetical protein [Planctomycetota bacterium]